MDSSSVLNRLASVEEALEKQQVINAGLNEELKKHQATFQDALREQQATSEGALKEQQKVISQLQQRLDAQGRRINIMSDSQSALLARHEASPMQPWAQWKADLAALASVWARCKSDGQSDRFAN
jgi:molybdopterin converting factor small subunit